MTITIISLLHVKNR